MPTSYCAEDYHQQLDDKITAIHQKTSGIGPVEYTTLMGSSLFEFVASLMAEVIAIAQSSLNKQCKLDHPLMWLLKGVINILAPFLMMLMSTSLRTGEFPSSWRHAIVHPHLKWPGANFADIANYRPVSNLT